MVELRSASQAGSGSQHCVLGSFQPSFRDWSCWKTTPSTACWAIFSRPFFGTLGEDAWTLRCGGSVFCRQFERTLISPGGVHAWGDEIAVEGSQNSLGCECGSRSVVSHISRKTSEMWGTRLDGSERDG